MEEENALPDQPARAALLSAWWRYCVDAGVLTDAAQIDAVTQPKLGTSLGGLLSGQVQINAATAVTAMPKRIVIGKALQLEMALFKGLLQRKALRLKLTRQCLGLCMSMLRIRHLSPQQIEMLGVNFSRCGYVHQRLDGLHDQFKLRHRINLLVFVWACLEK